MIIYVKMNIFESPAQVIVNTVNTVGVMGKGLAKQYKTLYPEMFKEYQKYCEEKLLSIGKLWIYKTKNKWILNFPTKKHWRNPSKIEYIEQGLKKFVDTYEEKGIRSISFPPLGCGNGGLNWENEVKPLMEKYLRDIDIDVFIHVPMDKKESKQQEHLNINDVKKWLNSEPNSLSFLEVWEDIKREIVNKSEINIKGDYYQVNINYSESLDDEVIDFCSIDKSHNELKKITREDLYEAWKLLRQNGVLTSLMLPSFLKVISNSMFSILSLLPYIDTMLTVISIEDGKEIIEAGIRLNPHNNGGVFQEALPL